MVFNEPTARDKLATALKVLLTVILETNLFNWFKLRIYLNILLMEETLLFFY